MATRKQRPFADDDGNIINVPPPDSPVAHIVFLLEYARQRGFQIGPHVQIGDVKIQVTDLRQAAGDTPKQPETTIWQENGYDGE